MKDNGDELNKWLENQAQTTKTILLHNQNIMQKLMSLQSSQLQLYEQNRALMSTVSDLCQIQKSLLENSSIQSGISKFSRPSADNAKLRIEAVFLRRFIYKTYISVSVLCRFEVFFDQIN